MLVGSGFPLSCSPMSTMLVSSPPCAKSTRRGARPKTAGDDFVRHVFREHNSRADQVARLAIDKSWIPPVFAYEQTWLHTVKQGRLIHPPFLYRAAFDGHKSATHSCTEWTTSRACWVPNFADEPGCWKEVAYECIVLGPRCCAMDCEAFVLLALTRAFKNMLNYNIDPYLSSERSKVPALLSS